MSPDSRSSRCGQPGPRCTERTTLSTRERVAGSDRRPPTLSERSGLATTGPSPSVLLDVGLAVTPSAEEVPDPGWCHYRCGVSSVLIVAPVS